MSQPLSWILTLFFPSARTCSCGSDGGNIITLLSSAYPQNQFPKGLHFQVPSPFPGHVITCPLELVIQNWWVNHLEDYTMTTFKISPFPISIFCKNIPMHWVPTSFYCPLIIKMTIPSANLIASQPSVREEVSGLTDSHLLHPYKCS